MTAVLCIYSGADNSLNFNKIDTSYFGGYTFNNRN